MRLRIYYRASISLLSVRQESPKYVKAKLTLIGVRSDSRVHTLYSARGYDVKLEGELKSERKRSSEVGLWSLDYKGDQV